MLINICLFGLCEENSYAQELNFNFMITIFLQINLQTTFNLGIPTWILKFYKQQTSIASKLSQEKRLQKNFSKNTILKSKGGGRDLRGKRYPGIILISSEMPLITELHSRNRESSRLNLRDPTFRDRNKCLLRSRVYFGWVTPLEDPLHYTSAYIPEIKFMSNLYNGNLFQRNFLYSSAAKLHKYILSVTLHDK